MTKVGRTERFPAHALMTLLAAKPFPRVAWEMATSGTLHLRIGNSPPITDGPTSLNTMGRFMDSAESFSSGFCQTWAVNETIYVETELCYRSATDKLARLPCVIIARTTHALIDDLRFYLDPSPFWSR